MASPIRDFNNIFLMPNSYILDPKIFKDMAKVMSMAISKKPRKDGEKE